MKKNVDKISKRIIFKFMGNKSVAQEVVRKTYKLKLVPKNEEQVNDLLRLVTQFRQACNGVINFLYDARKHNVEIRSPVELHKYVYKSLRKQCPFLNADYCLQVIRKTFEAWKSQNALKNSKKHIQFKGYVARGTRHTCTIYNDQSVSISVPGVNKMYRIRLPFQCRQDVLSDLFALKYVKFCELKYYPKKKEFHLHIPIEYPVTYNDYDKVVGVDLGIEYMLVYVDGNTYQVIYDPELFRSSEHHRDLCAELQAKGTRSSKRRLKSLKGKQTRLGSGYASLRCEKFRGKLCQE